MVSQILPSGVSLYSLTRSLPFCERSPIRLALSGGHSTSSSPVGGVGGGSGVSKLGGGGSSTSTPSSTSSSFGFTVVQVRSR